MKFLIFYIFVFYFCISDSHGNLCVERVENGKNKISEKCFDQLVKLCTRKDLLFTFWDASSRQIHTGLTATNNQDLGNFDLCMSIDEKLDNVDLTGKYCPLQWATTFPKTILQELVVALEEYNPMNLLINNGTVHVDVVDQLVKYDLEATDNFILLGSICIPDGCSPKEFTKFFNPFLYPVNYSIQDATTNCFTRKSTTDMDAFQIVITILICLLLLIIIFSTAYHVWLHNCNQVEPINLVKAFSILHNGNKLITTSKGNPDQIQCIHGLRFLSMIWVIAGHAYSVAYYFPQINHQFVENWKTQMYSEYIQAGHYAVDTFFFLSGLFLAYGYMKQMDGVSVSKQLKSIPLMIFQRYLRLTPAVAGLYFVSLSFFKAMGDGPLWNSTIDSVNEICKKYWWRYFLYIQNYNSDMCYLHTWYLSADMQMFIVSPVVLIPAALYFRKNLRILISAIGGLTVFCVALTVVIRYIVDDYDNEYDTHSRLSNYLVGIIGGIVMHTFRGKRLRISKWLNLALWIISLVFMIFLILYLYDITEHPTKDKTNFFYAIQRPIWSACILWIVFSCHQGYGGIINRFLSISFFQIGSRLSYCMYIVHIIVILYNMGTIRTYQYITDYSMFLLLCGNVIVSVIVSTIWTLTFEAPMIILTKMLLEKFEHSKK